MSLPSGSKNPNPERVMQIEMLRTFFRRISPALLAATFLSAPTMCLQAADFLVQTPGGAFSSYYTFNGGSEQNPVITLVRGATYTFQISASSAHPFYIDPPAGVENNDITSGIVTFHVPTDAVNDTILYQCSTHYFGSVFRFVDPPAPPEPPIIQIVGLTVGTNLVLTSTGTNTWTTIPEYSTNLVTTNWYALTVQSNRFNNGTNEAICGLPPGNAVFLRIRATQQTP